MFSKRPDLSDQPNTWKCVLNIFIIQNVFVRYGEKFVKDLQEKCADIFCGWIIAKNDVQTKSMWIIVVQKMAIIESKVIALIKRLKAFFF